MPTGVKREDGEYVIYDKRTGEKKGRSKSKRKAKIAAAIRDKASGHAQEALVEALDLLEDAVLDRQDAQGGFEFERALAFEREVRTLMQEAAAAAIPFDPSLHPRGRMGRWIEALNKLSALSALDKKRVRRREGKTFGKAGLEPLAYHSANEIGTDEATLAELVRQGVAEQTTLRSGKKGYRRMPVFAGPSLGAQVAGVSADPGRPKMGTPEWHRAEAERKGLAPGMPVIVEGSGLRGTVEKVRDDGKVLVRVRVVAPGPSGSTRETKGIYTANIVNPDVRGALARARALAPDDPEYQRAWDKTEASMRAGEGPVSADPGRPGKKPYPGSGRFVVVQDIGGGRAVVVDGANTEDAARAKARKYPGSVSVHPNEPGSPGVPGTYAWRGDFVSGDPGDVRPLTREEGERNQARLDAMTPEERFALARPGETPSPRQRKLMDRARRQPGGIVSGDPGALEMLDQIGPGDRVTIRTPQGQERTGRAVMLGPAGWVLNMGGRHGTPDIVDERNIVSVRKARKPGPTIPGGPRTPPWREGPVSDDPGVSRERARDDAAMERVEERMFAADMALLAAQRENERVMAAFSEKYPSGEGVSATDQAALDRVGERMLDAQLASDSARREQARVLGLYRERYGGAVSGDPGTPSAGADLSSGDLPPVRLLRHLSDDQVKQLVDRIIPQRKPFKGESWPESDPAFKDYPRRVAEEANKRARRRYEEGPVSDDPGTRAALKSLDRQIEWVRGAQERAGARGESAAAARMGAKVAELEQERANVGEVVSSDPGSRYAGAGMRDPFGAMKYRIVGKFRDTGGIYDDSKTGSLRTAIGHAQALVDEGGGDVVVFDDGRPIPAREFIARHGSVVSGDPGSMPERFEPSVGPEGETWQQRDRRINRERRKWEVSVAAKHPDPEINKLYKARREAATAADYGGTSYKRSQGWVTSEQIADQLRKLDPDGDWYYEGFNYDTMRWEVNRRPEGGIVSGDPGARDAAARSEMIGTIRRLYDEGASLATIVSTVGNDDEALRMIGYQLGRSVKNLRAQYGEGNIADVGPRDFQDRAELLATARRQEAKARLGTSAERPGDAELAAGGGGAVSGDPGMAGPGYSHVVEPLTVSYKGATLRMDSMGHVSVFARGGWVGGFDSMADARRFVDSRVGAGGEAVAADPGQAGDPSDRDVAISIIRDELKRRSGKTWSVTGGRGTGWGWITVTAPPKRRGEYGYMSEADRAELAALLGLDNVHSQGVNIAASSDYRREYVDRARGKVPSTIGQPYWD